MNIKTYNTKNGYCLTLTDTTDTIETLTKAIPELKEPLLNAILELKDHFDDGSWDIDARSVLSDILYDVLGFHLDELVFGIIAHQLNLDIEYNEKGIYLIKPRRLVWYNHNLDRMKVSINRPSSNYEQIGCL